MFVLSLFYPIDVNKTLITLFALPSFVVSALLLLKFFLYDPVFSQDTPVFFLGRKTVVLTFRGCSYDNYRFFCKHFTLCYLYPKEAVLETSEKGGLFVLLASLLIAFF